MHIPIPEYPEYKRPELKVAETPAAYDLDKSDYQYHLAEAGRSTSFIIKKSNNEKFVPASILGRGGFGRVRLFISEQDSSHMFAVKNVLREGGSQSQADIDGRVRASIREIDYLAKVHPGLSPYLLMNFINKRHFDNRMLMPYFPGTTLMNFVITYISNTPEFVLLMLKVAQEVARVHQLGLYHGDVRDGNFLIERSKTLEFGIPSFTVRMIDFDHGGEIGKDRFAGVTELSHDELFTVDVNERIDVAELRTWMCCCKNDLYITIPDAESDIDKYFPAFRQFVNHSIVMGDDEHAPDRELQEFINYMTENLQDWERANNLKNSGQKRSSTHLNLFAEKPLAMNDDDDIAKEFEKNSFMLW